MAGSIGWQEAITRLAGEKTRAETAAGLIKRLGDAAAVTKAELGYGEAKAEIDAVIAGLGVALADGRRPASQPDLEASLARAEVTRRELGRTATALAQARPGTKSLVVDLLVAVLPALVEAVASLAEACLGQDRLRRESIRTQLEAQRWRDFSALDTTG